MGSMDMASLFKPTMLPSTLLWRRPLTLRPAQQGSHHLLELQWVNRWTRQPTIRLIHLVENAYYKIFSRREKLEGTVGECLRVADRGLSRRQGGKVPGQQSRQARTSQKPAPLLQAATGSHEVVNNREFVRQPLAEVSLP
mmetsp:Transcript_117178/g.207389  ORF Transcript_117178/g.207389 Transcript_117178/m.207389 type:complete len:140 (-) Transcript_117178:115-534(-)